jgi:hypothetical protein
MRIISFAILIFIIAVSKTSFSTEKDSIINKVFVLIYNEKYIEAHNEISANQTILGNFYSDVLEIDLLWWEFVQLDQNNDKQKEFISFLEKFDSAFENNSELKLRQLIKNSYLIRYELKSYHIIGAINTRTTLKTLLDEITPEELIFLENKIKLLRLYKTLFNYFNNLINPLFNKNKRKMRTDALVQISHFSKDNDIIIKTLSLYFLGQIYLNIEKDQDLGIRCFAELSGYYTNNTLFKEVIKQYN